ncbi:MAG: sugar transferase [Anaerolineae bacterium]|nr:sugar transferase [Anaerolineae bacterium]
MTKRFSLGFSLFLVFSDLAIVVLALLLATHVRMTLPYGREASTTILTLPVAIYILTSAIWFITYLLSGVYDPKHTVRLVGELQVIIQATFFAFFALAGALFMTYRAISRLQIIYFAIIALVLVCLHRVAVRGFFRLIGGRTFDARKVLIIGTGETAQDTGRTIKSYGWAGLYLVGFVSESDQEPTPDQTGDLPGPVLGPLYKLTDFVEFYDVNEVVFALPPDVSIEIRPIVSALTELSVNIRIVPDYTDLAFLQVQVEDFGGMPLLSLKEPALSPFQRLVKRIFDLIVSIIGLIPALLVMGIIALVIRLDSPGPAIFKQERYGEGGKIFTMIKFRTMYIDAEKRRDEVITHDENGNIIHKRADDPRVTRVGRWLRRTSLDELPNLFNVLTGDMSLVGPRPEMPWLVEKYEPWQRKRFEVPQGMTGWWQISGRADKPMHLHTEEDLFYIRNYSLWLDIQILLRTAGAVTRRRGAF